jgi:hypothetical protein
MSDSQTKRIGSEKYEKRQSAERDTMMLVFVLGFQYFRTASLRLIGKIMTRKTGKRKRNIPTTKLQVSGGDRTTHIHTPIPYYIYSIPIPYYIYSIFVAVAGRESFLHVFSFTEKFGIKFDYVLCPGTVERRKVCKTMISFILGGMRSVRSDKRILEQKVIERIKKVIERIIKNNIVWTATLHITQIEIINLKRSK